jgi:hypothetical protein
MLAVGSMSRYPKAEIDRSLEEFSWPAWVDRVRAEPAWDPWNEPAIDVLVVVQSGEWGPFSDGALLNDIALQVHDHLVARGIGLRPFVRFVSADDIQAA